MSVPLARVTVCSDLACNGGVEIADLPIVDTQACSTIEEIQNGLVQRRFQVAVPSAWDEADELVIRRVFRLAYSDGSPYDEVRLSERRDSSGADGLTTCLALGIEFDLADRDQLVYRVASTQLQFAFSATDTVANLLTTYVLGALPGTWALGTITPSDTITVNFDKDTPLSAALKILAAANLAAGAVYELSARRNGTTGYYLDCSVYNTGATVPDLLTGKSLRGTVRTLNQQDQTTRVFPFGSDGGGCGDAWFLVTAVTVNVSIAIADYLGSGVNPIVNDDDFNGLYVVDQAGGTHAITSTVKSTQRLGMASTSGISAGDWVQVAVDSAKTPLAYVDDTGAQATYGIRVGVPTFSAPSHTNWVQNADLSDWTGATPTSWSGSGTGLAKQTTLGLWLRGGWSADLTGGAAPGLVWSRSVYCPVGTITYIVWIYNITTAGATHNVTLRDGLGADQAYPLSSTAIADLATTGTWLAFTRTYSVTSAGSKTLRVQVDPHQCYVDSAQVTIQPAGITAPTAWGKGSGGATLRLGAIQHLQAAAQPIATYDVTTLDLYRMDPVVAGEYEKVSHGGLAKLTDLDLGVTTTQRAVRVETNHLVLHDTKLALAAIRREQTRLLA